MARIPNRDSLHKIDEICAYYRKSESTIMMLIQAEGFPATKIGGIWTSRKSLIDAWESQRILDDTYQRNNGKKFDVK